MHSLLIEGGIYLLLFFAPLAFGGVELWAQGAIQIVAGIVAAAWAFGRLQGSRDEPPRIGLLRGLSIGAPIVLFLALVLLQLAPLPPSLLSKLSPSAHRLYESTLPGYAEGRPFDVAELPEWLLAKQRERLPQAGEGAEGTVAGREAATPVIPASERGAAGSFRRTLTLSPPQTRERFWLLLSCAALFMVAASHFSTRERLMRLMTAAVLSAGAVSLFGIIQRLTWNGKLYWLREGDYRNPFGPFVNRNSYAAFAGTVLPIALCLAFGALRQWEKGQREALPRLLLWSSAAAAMTVGIALSLSRGGLIAAALAIGIVGAALLYFGRRGAEMMLLGSVLAAAVILLVWIGPEMVIERVGTLSEGQSIPSFAQRMKAWNRTSLLIGDYPILGAGFGAFRFSFMKYAPPGEGWWTTAHNEYLEILCDTGIAGALLASAGLIAWLFLVSRPARFRGRSERYAWAGLAAGIAGLLVHSAVSSNLQVPANGLLLAILAGALLALAARHEPRSEGRR